MTGNQITKVICDGVDVTEDLMPDCVIDSEEKIVRVVYSEKYDKHFGCVNYSLPLICVELKPKHVVIHYSNGEGGICYWDDNPGVARGCDVSDVDNGSVEKITEDLKREFSEMIPKQKLVRPQMTVEARDILKSWDGETNSDKVKVINNSYEYLREISKNRAIQASDKIAVLMIEIEERKAELSTLAGYLAISICINFVAIGWVAWTKGWLL